MHASAVADRFVYGSKIMFRIGPFLRVARHASFLGSWAGHARTAPPATVCTNGLTSAEMGWAHAGFLGQHSGLLFSVTVYIKSSLNISVLF